MNHAEEITTTDEARVRRGSSPVQLLVRALLSALYLLSSFPLGLLWSVVLVSLLLIGLPLTIIWVGLPILAFAMLVCVVGANTERWRLAALLGTSLSSPYRPPPGGPILARLRSRATDPALWRGLL
jgi:hypothetical protein